MNTQDPIAAENVKRGDILIITEGRARIARWHEEETSWVSGVAKDDAKKGEAVVVVNLPPRGVTLL